MGSASQFGENEAAPIIFDCLIEQLRVAAISLLGID
jgi:hypothetical protein